MADDSGASSSDEERSLLGPCSAPNALNGVGRQLGKRSRDATPCAARDATPCAVCRLSSAFSSAVASPAPSSTVSDKRKPGRPSGSKDKQKARVCTAKEKQERQGRDGGQGCCSSCSFVQGRHGRGEHAQPLSALHAARLFKLLGSSCCSALHAARLFELLGSSCCSAPSKCIQILAAQVRYAIRATREGMD